MHSGFETGRMNMGIDINEAAEKAKNILVDPINMDDFSDLYKDVEADKQYVAEMEAKFAEDESRDSEIEAMVRKTAKVLEAIIFEQIELSNWLGDTAMTIQASRYDDIKHGVDTIVEFDEGDGRNASHLALAIDVTTSHELNKKFKRIFEEIERGALTEIKYFVSESLDIRGHKSNVPRVVVGADRKTIFDLAEKWLEKDNKALSEHVIQVILIEEIYEQLVAFKNAAERAGQHGIVSVYEKTIGIVEGIRDGKEFSEDMLFKAGEDKVLQAIRDNLAYANR